jgi:hypothetical protein
MLMEEEIERLMKKKESELSIEEKQKLHNYWYDSQCRYCELNGSCQQLNLYGCEIFDEHLKRRSKTTKHYY